MTCELCNNTDYCKCFDFDTIYCAYLFLLLINTFINI